MSDPLSSISSQRPVYGLSSRLKIDESQMDSSPVISQQTQVRSAHPHQFNLPPPPARKKEQSFLEVFNENADEAAYHIINGVTFGLGGWVLDKLGLTSHLDKDSTVYKTGDAIDTAIGIASLRPDKLIKAGVKGLSRLGGSLSDIALSTKKAISGASLGSVVAGAKKLGKATLGVATRLDYRKTFFEAYPHLKGKVFVHHAIEQKMQRRFSHLISKSELHSLENLRGIPIHLNNSLHLRTIRKSWDNFYFQYPNPTKQQLLEHASKIDSEFGHLFMPPI